MPNSAGINQMTSSNNELSIYPNPFSQQTTLQFPNLQVQCPINSIRFNGREFGIILLEAAQKI